MAKLEIEIQIRKTLKPSTPTPDHLRTLKLSFFDQIQSRIGYVPVLLYYLPSSEGNSKAENTERCDKLQKSLAETLAKFYPLAGRFRKDDFSIDCNDEGVEYLEAKVDADLAEFLLHEDGPNVELLDDLLPWPVPPKADLPPTGPLIGVQVNLFNCGGLVIGMQISHIPADAFTMTTFVNEWARTSRTGTTKGCPPSFGQLSPFFPILPLPDVQISPVGGDAKPVTRRFVFDALAIAKLKEGCAPLTRPTRVAVVMSLIWKVLAGLSSAKHGHSRDTCFLIPIDLRRRTSLPSLEHVLGNFCLSAVATLDQANQSSKELNDFVNSVGSASREAFVGFGKESMEELSVPYKIMSQKDDVFLSTTWCRFPWYEADFGWGKPFWVSVVSHQGALELTALFDTKDGDGVEAWISLKENDMAEFEKDPDILTYSPPQKRQLIL